MADVEDRPEFRRDPFYCNQFRDNLVYPTRESSQRLKVIDVSLYKKTKGSQHEFVIARVQDQKTFSYHYYRFQRTLEEGRRSPLSTSSLSLPEASPTSSSDQSQDSSAKSSRPSDIVSGTFPATDTIEWLPDWPANNEGILSMGTLPMDQGSHSLYLYDIVLIALMIHTQDPQYSLLDRNCYFFAGAIIAILELVCSAQFVQSSPLPGNMRSGSWHLPIPHIFNKEDSQTSVALQNLRQMYEAEAQHFVNAIMERERQEADRIRDIEEKAREEVEKGRKEAEKGRKEAEEILRAERAERVRIEEEMKKMQEKING